jgi:hypothetical protein
MQLFVNPFKKHDVSEFPDVLVPLQQAPHRASTASQQQTSIVSVPSCKFDKSEKAESDTGSIFVNGLTIERLKAEVEADLAASELQSSYDRTHSLASVGGFKGVLIFTGKSKVINKAIQDIGIGRYQWQLFVLCGFGWLADKYIPQCRKPSRNLILTCAQFMAPGRSSVLPIRSPILIPHVGSRAHSSSTLC